MPELSATDKRSLGRVERLAAEVIRQCGFLRKNMAESSYEGERVRWVMIAIDAVKLAKEAEKAERRYMRERRRGES